MDHSPSSPNLPSMLMIKPNEIELGELIGQGSYGTVFSGRFRLVNVAIKIFKNHPKVNTARFLEEAELMR
jgi:predicted Ser/Thr protein kinase